MTVLALLAGIVIWMWDPKWYGPSWYRERDATYDTSVPLNAAIAASVRTTPTITSARAVGRDEPLERWRAHLISDEHGHPSAMQRIGVVRGHLLLYEDALVFAADVREDRMRGAPVTVVIPAESIRPSTASPPAAGRTALAPARICRRVSCRACASTPTTAPCTSRPHAPGGGPRSSPSGTSAGRARRR